MKFIKKPVTVEAFQMTRERRQNNKDWPEWLNEAWNKPHGVPGAVYPKHYPDSDGTDNLMIRTLEGVHQVSWDDWIIRGIKGELYPCKPEIFAATYDEATFSDSKSATVEVLVTDKMLGAFAEKFWGPGWNTEIAEFVFNDAREAIKAAMEQANLEFGPGKIDGFVHKLETGESDVQPSADEELVAYLGMSAELLAKIYDRSDNLNIKSACERALNMAERLGEEHRSMYIPYSQMVRNLFKEMGTPEATLMHAGVGVAGEAGELIDAIKKAWVYGKKLDAANLLEELGDLTFYMQQILNTFGWTWADVRMANRMKLAKRYPDGVYSDHHAQARLDKSKSK